MEVDRSQGLSAGKEERQDLMFTMSLFDVAPQRQLHEDGPRGMVMDEWVRVLVGVCVCTCAHECDCACVRAYVFIYCMCLRAFISSYVCRYLKN